MAVGTPNKRGSLLGLSLPFGRVLPVPDGALDEEAERLQFIGLYAFGDTTVPPSSGVYVLSETLACLYRLRIEGSMSSVVKRFKVGQQPTLAVSITVDGELTDPSALTFQLYDPERKLTEYVYGTDSELVRDATGEYHVRWPVTLEGPHRYRFVNEDEDGVAVGADEWQFIVERTLFAP